MAKAQVVHVCSECGGESLKWQGQCPHCEAWNSLSRVAAAHVAAARSAAAAASSASPATGVSLLSAQQTQSRGEARHLLGIGELDRVLGGGLTAGSVCLLGGEPGIGKSTLLLQLAAALATEAQVLYASGEESIAQTAERARRLGLSADGLQLVNDYDLDRILTIATSMRPRLLVIDSIQTMQCAAAEHSPGSAPQLRECTALLVRHAKQSGTAVFLVGHVTKDGAIAGPKLLEHLVDTVLYFEADSGSRFRLLRATKNRFGPVNELAFFHMSAAGLREVRNPSAIFLARGEDSAPGSIVMVAHEGGRAMLVEVQALADRSRQMNPRRVAQGLDATRLAMLLAVLSRHADLPLAEYDVFANLAGGLRLEETATDLPIALALASSLEGVILPRSLAAFGEVGLTGELRPVAHGEERIRELAKQGYTHLILPRQNLPRERPAELTLLPASEIRAALSAARALARSG